MGADSKIAFLSFFSPNGIFDILLMFEKNTYTCHCKHTYRFIHITYYGRICKQLGTVMYALWFVSNCFFFNFRSTNRWYSSFFYHKHLRNWSNYSRSSDNGSQCLHKIAPDMYREQCRTHTIDEANMCLGEMKMKKRVS